MATVSATQERLYLDGEWVETGDWIEVRSPYSDDVDVSEARAGRADAERAVDAAARAMRDPIPAWKRADILERVSALIAERNEELARTICMEAGKPLRTARIEASRAA